jgi:hypothetical protein
MEMLRNVIIMLAAGGLLVASGASAQQSVYKWVDEDGVVHFSDQPPEDAEDVEAESVTIETPNVVPSHAVTTSREAAAITAAAERNRAARTAQESDQPTPQPQEPAVPDISEMSLEELDARCDAAREEKIAPLREAEIAKCQADMRNDPAFCERFNADFGEGGRTVTGSIRPRMFDDLPECVEALQERNRRPRR